MKKSNNGITIGIVLIILVGLLFIWFIQPQLVEYLKIEIVIIIVLVAGGAFIIKQIKRRKDKLHDTPPEDEFTNQAKLIAGNQAFYYSHVLWFVIFIFNRSFSSNEEMLGIGIMGSAAIYGILVMYYKTTGDFLDEK